MTTVVGKGSGTVEPSMIYQVMFHSVGKISLAKSLMRVEEFAEAQVMKNEAMVSISPRSLKLEE